ncbi:hypothetical protein [Pseudomonas savastanoi]|uniref:hypothetical protein n=1 Tax=Pseudomonas savastanoi TaxID=29438 RepID=UPI000EFFA339|nr:hypothetical protein [Pseudomonas savastanoi]RMN59599.1 hypothetical protein ALQ55_03802 [Pseudomonas savastanoi pv. savastanoi]
MLHSKNTTAPPVAQEPSEIPNKTPSGFIYYTVDVRTPVIRQTGLPILVKALAVELYLALSIEFRDPRFEVIIQACAADAEDRKSFERRAARNKDLIISCRSADRPGHEYLARLGQYGEYDPRQPAPQNEEVPFRGAQGVGQ